MSAWLTGLPLIGYGMAATCLLRRHGRGVLGLVSATGGAVAVAALAALLTALSTGPVPAGPIAASPWAPLLGVAVAVAAASVAAVTAAAATGPAVTTAMPARPRLSGRALFVAGLSEGVALYGLAVCILLLGAA